MSNQIRLVHMGAFLSLQEAEVFREEFFTEHQEAIDEGLLVLIQDDIASINNHFVIRIMAQNPQLELELE